MAEFEDNNYKLRTKAGSTEVMLFAHGGWCTANGKVFVPEGMVVRFYCAHGVFGTKGLPIGEGLMGGTNNPIPTSVQAGILEHDKNVGGIILVDSTS